MLWFIIKDWKIDLVVSDIKQKIIENDKKDKVIEKKFILKKEDSFISENWYYEKNKRNWKNFTLYHCFLDFSSIWI